MSMYTIITAFLMFVNALAILNEERFLKPYGWGFQEMSGGRVASLKGQIIGLLHAVQYLRVPLIVMNVITIFGKLLFG
ncbi:hypothetical protein KFL_002210030 [Klebsormidium nitens]|uniref:Yos1-like protein n=1 Tax=Klebsormidium nitens TaxID=105231 RepID=A0A1Y1I6U3_KLENI|nr:hypothetical protein KFL_002210030 [Klebsormidium nitens]|eukprot:GAQ85139.1 hypothetical protein KFL_002210030 [Klebsormidium nitens]